MMDRKELSFMIKNMRENSGVSKYRASKDSGLTEIQIGYMDDATHSYSIGNMFRYLNAIGGYLQIRSSIYKNSFILKSREDFVIACKEMRATNQLSQKKAALKIGVNSAIITGIESRNIDTSVDKFIQCVYGLEYEIIVKKAN